MANLSNSVWAGGGTVLRDQQADRNVRSYERRHRAARQIADKEVVRSGARLRRSLSDPWRQRILCGWRWPFCRGCWDLFRVSL